MRKYLFRIENLLLLFPLLLFCSNNIFYSNSVLDIHLHDTYIVFDIYYFYLGVFIFLIVPYFFHFFLRWIGKRNRTICSIHVFLTLALLILFFALFFTAISEPAIPQQGDIELYKNFQEAGKGNPKSEAMAYVIGALIFVQIVFIVCFWFLYWGTFESEKD